MLFCESVRHQLIITIIETFLRRISSGPIGALDTQKAEILDTSQAETSLKRKSLCLSCQRHGNMNK